MKRALKNASLGLMASAALTLAIPSMALARDGGPKMGAMNGPRGEMSFADMDADGNGQITTEDFSARAAERFAAADADGNGAVTSAELQAYFVKQANERLAEVEDKPSDLQIAARAERMADRMLERADANDNGTLEAAEMQPKDGFGRMIDRFDTDDDNAVSEAEFDSAKKRMEARMDRRGHGGKGERGYGQRGEHGSRGEHGPRGSFGERY